MRTVEATATISEDRHITVLIPSDVPLGTYKILVILEEPPAEKSPASLEDTDLDDFPVIDLGPWPENLSLRREDIYDDWGR